MQVSHLCAPIGIVDEHPEWSTRLMAELQRRGLPFEKIDHSSHCYDPADRHRRYAVVVNRSSPSSHRRGPRAAAIDVGGIEYLVGRDDGRVYSYDVNATSNFVADAPTVLGFDPLVPFVDYIVRVAARGKRPAWSAP